jgi:RNA polymerase sigma-70 factor (ECF subfamily)
MNTSVPPKKDAQLRVMMTDAHRDYEKLLHNRANFKINDLAISDDLVQITFMKTWSYLAKGGKIDTMKAFLYHVLNGLIIDEYRKHKSTSLDTLLEKGFNPSIDDTDRLINTLDGRGALLLIDKLPIKYQKIMHMKYVQGLSTSEMALITNQTKNTIAVQAHRGLIELRTLYTDNTQ